MRQWKVPSFLGSLFFLMFFVVLSTQALDERAQTAVPSSTEMNVYCLSDRSEPVIYFSEVFRGKADPPSSGMREVSFKNIAKDFLVFLQQKYSYKSDSSYPTTCVGRTSAAADAPGSKEKLEESYKQANKQIVETGWKNQ